MSERKKFQVYVESESKRLFELRGNNIMMLCPKCNEEMVKGTTTFMGATGLTPMMCSFTADAEKEKNMFARNEITKTMMQGLEVDAYCCEDCKIVMPIIE